MEKEQMRRQRYEAALESFVDRIKADKNILAVYVYGSLARGDPWEESDIDLFVVTSDEKRPFQAFSLVEDGIHLHAEVYSRSHFRRVHERLLRGSALHHIFSSGRLVYAADGSLHEYYRDGSYVGDRDRELLAMLYGCSVLGGLYMAEKSLRAKRDRVYGFYWLFRAVHDLACVEVVRRGQVLEREVLYQALASNPALFQPLIDLPDKAKDESGLRQGLDMVEAHMVTQARAIFKPLFDYLAQAGDVREASELQRHFARRLRLVEGDTRPVEACRWLAEKGFLQKVCAPVRLTTKSRLEVDEEAYFYSGGEE